MIGWDDYGDANGVVGKMLWKVNVRVLLEVPLMDKLMYQFYVIEHLLK